MTVDTPGVWIHHCQVVNRRSKGMVAEYHAVEQD